MILTPYLLVRFFDFEGGHSALLLIWLFIPASALLCGVEAGLMGVQDFRARTTITVVRCFALLLVAWLGIGSMGLMAPAVGLLGSHLLVILGGLVYMHSRYRMVDLKGIFARDVWHETWGFTRWAIICVTGMLLMNSIDTLFLTKLKGLESVATYNIALPIMRIFLILMVVPMVFTPIAAELWNKGRTSEIVRLCAFVAKAMTLLGWCLVIFMIPAAEAVIVVLFGTGLSDAGVPLIILCAGVPVVVMAHFFVNILAAVDRPRQVAGVVVLGVMVNVVLNALLVGPFGVLGAATSTVLSYAALLITAYVVLGRHVRVNVFGVDHILATLCGGVCCLAAWWLGGNVDGLILPVGVGLGCVLLYCALCWKLVLLLCRQGFEIIRGHDDAGLPGV